MHLQENTLFDLGVSVKQKCCPVPSISCDICSYKIEVAAANGKGIYFE